MDSVVLKEMLVSLDLPVEMEYWEELDQLDHQVLPERWLKVKRFLDPLDHLAWTELLGFLDYQDLKVNEELVVNKVKEESQVYQEREDLLVPKAKKEGKGTVECPVKTVKRVKKVLLVNQDLPGYRDLLVWLDNQGNKVFRVYQETLDLLVDRGIPEQQDWMVRMAWMENQE